MDKPTKPTNLMPRSFGGLKENFSESLQETGVEPNVPVIYHGANFNYEKDTIGKELDYCEKIVDFINALPIGKTITTDSNNQLQYADLAQDVPIATTERAGIVKPDGDTITIEDDGTIRSNASGNFANKNIDNLTTLGNARLQYTPFAINDGAVLNGNNNTLTTNVEILYYKRNISEVGTLTKSKSIISGFTSSNYANLPSAFTPESSTWEIVIKFTTGSSVSSSQSIFSAMYGSSGTYAGISIEIYSSKATLRGSTNGSSYNINIASTSTLSANTTYWAKATFDGSTYKFYLSTNGTNYTQQGTYSSTSPVKNIRTTRLGVYGNQITQAFSGSIDLEGCYTKIAGQFHWRGVINGSSSDYDWTSASGTTLICAPCRITTVDGRTKDIEVTTTFDTADSSPSQEIKNFNQPIATGNYDDSTVKVFGEIGSASTFAVGVSNNISAVSGHPLYYAFDSSASTYTSLQLANASTLANKGHYLLISNPYPLKISDITFKDYPGYTLTSAILEGSNDSTNWTEVATITRQAANNTETVAIDSQNFYSYYRLIFLATAHTTSYIYYWDCYSLEISGTYLSSDTTNSINDGSYKILRDCETGSLAIAESLKFSISNSQPVSPSEGYFWLDNSIIPATLKKYHNGAWLEENDKVYIGDFVISNHAITSITNRQFNNSGYLINRYFPASSGGSVPNYSAGISITSPYTASRNGLIIAAAASSSATQLVIDGVVVSYADAASTYFATRHQGFIASGSTATFNGTGTFYPLIGV